MGEDDVRDIFIRQPVRKVARRAELLGESLQELQAQGPPTPALEHLFVDASGYGRVPEDDFVEHFAADVDRRGRA